MIDDRTLWIVIIGMAVGSYLLRFLFLGVVGDRAMPAWVLRHLRYTAVAVLPALVAPMILLPADGGAPDPARLTAAIVTAGVGYATGKFLLALAAGAATLFAALFLLG